MSVRVVRYEPVRATVPVQSIAPAEPVLRRMPKVIVPRAATDLVVPVLAMAEAGEDRLAYDVNRALHWPETYVQEPRVVSAFRSNDRARIREALRLETWRDVWAGALFEPLNVIVADAARREALRTGLLASVGSEAAQARARQLAEWHADYMVEQADRSLDTVIRLLATGAEARAFSQFDADDPVVRAFQSPRRIPNSIRGLIAKETIALTPRQLGAVVNRFHANLDRGMSFEEAFADQRGFRDSLISQRADMIQRTQASWAVNEGRYLQWEAAVAAGELDRETTWVTWIGIADERICDECYNLSGRRRRLGNDFDRRNERPVRNPLLVDPLERQLTEVNLRQYRDVPRDSPFLAHPPLHPNCRCVVEIMYTGMTRAEREVRAQVAQRV